MGKLVEETRVGDMTFRLFDTGDNSSKFGPCTVCEKHASEVFHQITLGHIDEVSGGGFYDIGMSGSSWGHRECLVGLRGSEAA